LNVKQHSLKDLAPFVALCKVVELLRNADFKSLWSADSF
jgi:hypothetical protein